MMKSGSALKWLAIAVAIGVATQVTIHRPDDGGAASTSSRIAPNASAKSDGVMGHLPIHIPILQ
jgi:hypothetical protein